MVALTVFFALGAVIAHLAAVMEARKQGETVSTRRWEVSVFYRDEEFIGWITSGSPTTKAYARVLAPYDFMLLAFLGAAFAAGSLAAAESLHCAGRARWLLLLAPLAFSAADFAEDQLLLAYIAAAQATPLDIRRLKTVTLIKFIALGAAANQAVILGLWALFA
jgi:hypothetical protein